MDDVFIKKGPVYVDGVLVFTATKDLMRGETVMPEHIIRADGSRPDAGEPMTELEGLISGALVEFTQ